MKIVTGVRFKKPGKIYYFDPDKLQIEKGMNVIVDTAMGEEFGEVMIPNRTVPEDKIVEPLKVVIRIANGKDYKRFDECKELEKKAFEVCKKKIKEHGLEMTLTDVEFILQQMEELILESL